MKIERQERRKHFAVMLDQIIAFEAVGNFIAYFIWDQVAEYFTQE